LDIGGVAESISSRSFREGTDGGGCRRCDGGFGNGNVGMEGGSACPMTVVIYR